ncbi:MAG TPA: carotenoid 1,2-hydratase, partial [Gammaproteobacteria bacterium]|nr:carotenoid 1,2-hydratase [Gammaproteobacteria bacterium]
LRPILADQELNLAVRYWEGAVSARGEQNGRPITGQGYVELTGYGSAP